MDRSDGIDGDKSRAGMQGLLKDVVTYHQVNDEPLEYTSWNGKVKYQLLQVPVSNDGDEFQRKACRLNWIEEIFQKSLDEGSEEDAMKAMLDYLVTRHPDLTKERLRELGLTPKRINEYEIAATISASNIGITQWREIVKCFKTYLDMEKTGFCVSEEMWRHLGKDHGEIRTGKCEWFKDEPKKRPQIVQWWTMNAADELLLRLIDFANLTADFDRANIKSIYSTYS